MIEKITWHRTQEKTLMLVCSQCGIRNHRKTVFRGSDRCLLVRLAKSDRIIKAVTFYEQPAGVAAMYLAPKARLGNSMG